MERADRNNEVRLQVLIATFGPQGLRKVVAMRLPRVPGVGYLVSWQLPEGDCPVPEQVASRTDIQVFKNRTRGVARNRNIAVSLATAPWCLHSDDDLVYLPGALQALMREIEARPEVDIVCCAYTCHGRHMKPYPRGPVPIGSAPKGWYANTFEIAFRRDSEAGRTPLNENFGAGAPFMRAGDEDLYLHDAACRGARGVILPLVLCRHDHDSTAERDGGRDWFVMTQGAVLSHIHPRTWPLRLLRHALRQERFPAFRYFVLGVRGMRHARRHGYFG